MNCDQARTEIIAYLKGELGEESVKRLEEHFARCPNCRHELEGARRLLSWTEAASEEGVVKAVEETIDKGILVNASDIHWEPQRDNSMLVRYRVDGVLHEAARFDPVLRGGITNRIKMMAEMDTSETRIPQDGRLPWKLADRDMDFDIRVSCQPYIFGEGFVMRILDKSNVLIGLERLGFYEDQLKILEELAHEPSGMIICTGPTGSGKTTTLYSMLGQVISPAVKVIAIEDPVEYQITGANQVQVLKKAGLTFATALRSFLRADPDVIYVGEIRDLETLMIAIQAAMTGHLIMTTLHTDEAVSALIRMVDMGAEPFLVSGTVVGIIAQRLVRKVCQSCKEPVEADPENPVMKALEITAEDLASHTLYRGKGCEVCRNTGYKGRTGVYEVLKMDKELGSLLVSRAPLREIRDAAIAKGFLTMREDQRRKVLDGITAPEEAFRVLV